MAPLFYIKKMMREKQMRNYHYIFWTKLYEYVFRKNENGENIIYMFHSIHDGETLPKEFKTNKESFEKFLESELRKRKASSISRIIEGKCRGTFAITFDDVFENVYINAYPILQQYNIPFTLFVATGLINKPGYLTSEELRKLSQDTLCTIGAHTVNHVRLRTNDRAYEEIIESKRKLENILEKEVEFFAYPYGSIFACSRKNIKQVEKVGFSAAFSTMKGFLPIKFDKYRFFLPRNNGDHYVKYLEQKEDF